MNKNIKKIKNKFKKILIFSMCKKKYIKKKNKNKKKKK